MLGLRVMDTSLSLLPDETTLVTKHGMLVHVLQYYVRQTQRRVHEITVEVAHEGIGNTYASSLSNLQVIEHLAQLRIQTHLFRLKRLVDVL